jgi:hypothetical protein
MRLGCTVLIKAVLIKAGDSVHSGSSDTMWCRISISFWVFYFHHCSKYAKIHNPTTHTPNPKP